LPTFAESMGSCNATFYNWRSKYGGMDAAMLSEMKAMAEENRRLKKMYAEMAIQNELLKDALGKK
jgi:putative transposase